MQNSVSKRISVAILFESLEVDYSTGTARWKVRPREHFATQRGHSMFNTAHAGREAMTTVDRHGYCSGMICILGVRARLQRSNVIWAMAHGKWSEFEIGHRNQIFGDDRLENLREQTPAEKNAFGRREGGVTGINGVTPVPSGRFKATVSRNGQRVHLGHFDTPEEALAVRNATAAELHGDFARLARPIDGAAS